MSQDIVLQHYGVKGMKWGVSRDRAPDGVAERAKEIRKERSDRLITNNNGKGLSKEDKNRAVKRGLSAVGGAVGGIKAASALGGGVPRPSVVAVGAILGAYGGMKAYDVGSSRKEAYNEIVFNEKKQLGR